MVSAAESPVHDNYKHLVTGADATDTVVLSAHSSPAYRVMRTHFSEDLEQEPSVVMGRTVGMEGVLKLYFEGDLNAGFAFGGQGDGRVAEVLPIKRIVHETVGDSETVKALDGSFRRRDGKPACAYSRFSLTNRKWKPKMSVRVSPNPAAARRP